MNSLILRGLKNSWHWLTKITDESRIAGLFRKAGKQFQKASAESCIVQAVACAEQTDAAYKRRFGGPLGRFWNRLVKGLRWLSRGINNSFFVRFFQALSENFFYYPLRFFGLFFLPMGVLSFLGAYLNHGGKTAIFLSLALCVAAAVLILIQNSIYSLCYQSRIISGCLRFFKVPVLKHDEEVARPPYRVGLVLGCLFGVIAIVANLKTALLLIVLITAACFVFSKTTMSVILLAGVLPFMPTMVMVAGSIGLAVCIAMKKVAGYDDAFSEENSSMNLFVTVMGIVFLIGACTSVTVGASLKIALVYLAFLVFYFVIVKTIHTTKNLRYFVNLLVFAAFPVALYGIYQNFAGFDGANVWIDQDMFQDISGRVISFFGNPNVLGEYLILAIMLAVVSFSASSNKKMKLVYAVIGLSCALCMIYTYSRGCWIGIILAIAIYLFLENRNLFWAACVVGVISIFFLPDSIVNRFSSIGNMADSSTSYRVYIWEGTLQMLKNFWLTGIGLGSSAFNKVYPIYAYSAITAPHPHNLYLLVLSETGVMGLLALLGVVVMYYKKLFYVISHTAVRYYKVLATALVAGMTGFLVQGMFDNVWYNYRVFLLFWIFIAVGTVVSLLNHREEGLVK